MAMDPLKNYPCLQARDYNPVTQDVAIDGVAKRVQLVATPFF